MKKKLDKTIPATVDRFENGLVVVDFGKMGGLVIPKKYLPPNLSEGDALQAEILTDELVSERKKHLAKAILKEILN